MALQLPRVSQLLGQREICSRLFGARRYAAWNWYLDQRKVVRWFHPADTLVPRIADVSPSSRKAGEQVALKVSSGPDGAGAALLWFASSRAIARKARATCGWYKSRQPVASSRRRPTKMDRYHIRHERTPDGCSNCRRSTARPPVGAEGFTSTRGQATGGWHADGTYEASFMSRWEPKSPPKLRHDACGIDMAIESLESITRTARAKVAPLRHCARRTQAAGET